MKSRDVLIRYIKERLQKEVSQSTNVSMTDVLRSQDDSTSPDELADSLLEMWLAGHVTQSSAACCLMLCVGRDDRVRNKILMELERYHLIGNEDETDLQYDNILQLSYTSNVVKEVLRLYPPAGGGFRQVKSTLEVGVRPSTISFRYNKLYTCTEYLVSIFWVFSFTKTWHHQC